MPRSVTTSEVSDEEKRGRPRYRLRAGDIDTLGPGMHADGDNLYLRVDPKGHKRFGHGGGGGRSWICRVTIDGKKRDFGIGSVRRVSLAKARKKANRICEQVEDGIDPKAKKDAEKQQRRLEAQRAVTFQQVADRYITSHAAGWRGNGSEEQWRQSLKDHVFPVIGDLPVAAIDTGLVMQVLDPIWRTRTETPNRIRGRIENILSYAKTIGLRDGANPGAWRENLKHLLPSPKRVKQAKRHAALPYQDMPAFMAALRKDTSIPARALEFAISTAARVGEALGAKWSEVDLKQRVWVIPPERMKTGREHRVPLSDAALAVLDSMSDIRTSDFIFPGTRDGARLFSAAVRRVLARIQPNLTVHGMRSTFSSWAAERTNYASEIRELCLAHQIGSAVERAYQRSDLFDRRRRLMADWAAFCTSGVGGDVVPMQRARARR
jgi:integrase